MPELPEVETIRRGLLPLVGQTIAAADWRPAKLRRPSPRPLSELAGRRLVGLRRHAKTMFWDLDDGATLTIHLGMTGKLLYARPGEPERPHTHLVLRFGRGPGAGGPRDAAAGADAELRFVDPRRFGLLRLHPPGAAADEADGHGVDALDAAFTPAALASLLAASRAPLKAFLLDQTKVAGLGNIYACEALWRAGLSPRRRACNTPASRVALLHASIRGVLEDSLAAGGTSFNDYVDALGKKGVYHVDAAVFRREGQPCPRCGAAVRRLVQAGRSTFYCRCQR